MKIIEVSIILKVVFVVILLSIPWNLMEVWKYTALIIIYQIAVEFGVGICWQPLMREITSISDRGEFFSNMRFIFMTLNTVFVFLLAFLVGDAMSTFQYKSLLYVSLFGFLLQFCAIKKIGIKQIVFENNYYDKVNKPLLKQIKENKKMWRVLILDLLFLFIGFTLNVVYLKTTLGYSSKLITLYISLNNLGGTLSLPLLGKFLDGNLHRASKYICKLYLIYMMVLVLLPSYTSGSIVNIIFVIILSLLSGVIASGIYLMMTILQHSLVRGEDSFMILNLYQIIIYVTTFISTNVFGIIINNSGNYRLSTTYSFSLDLYKFVYVFLILGTMVIVKIVFPKIAISHKD